MLLELISDNYLEFCNERKRRSEKESIVGNFKTKGKMKVWIFLKQVRNN